MGQYSRTISEKRSRREFKRKLKDMIDGGHFSQVPKERIENGYGSYTYGVSTLVVKYEVYEPAYVIIFTPITRESKELSGLLNLIGMRY